MADVTPEQKPRLEWRQDARTGRYAAEIKGITLHAHSRGWKVHGVYWPPATSLLEAQLAAESRARELLREALKMLGEGE